MEVISMLNTQAVDLICRSRSSDGRQAAALLLSALQNLQIMSTIENSDDEEQPDHHEDSDADTESSALQSSESIVMNQSITESSYKATPTLQHMENQGESDLPDYVARPFELQIITRATTNRLIELAQVSAVLLFNLALINHREGMEKGNSKKLRTAIHLYQLSMQQIQIDSDHTPFSSDTLIVAATIHHNESLLHIYFCDSLSAIRKIGQLKTVMDLLDFALFRPQFQLREEDGLHRDDLLRELYFFRLQIAFLRMYDFHVAVAA